MSSGDKMSSRDVHKEPFTEETITKLEIFEKYVEAWLPVFIYSGFKEIFIYDFFAGTGKDKNNIEGSPLRVINVIEKYTSDIIKSNTVIKLIFNELDLDKVDNLKAIVKEKLEKLDEIKEHIEIEIYREEFNTLFFNIYKSIVNNNSFPRFMFIDQNGIKQVTEEILLKIAELKRTDMIFFISSSYARRFSELESFQKYLKINKESFSESKPFHSHRVVTEYYKSLIPNNKEYYITPFSIKKNANVYGLVFCSSHSYGIEKFLRIGWQLNPNTGDANFNIDEEAIADGNLSLFEEDNIPQKLQLFENKLASAILKGNILTNKDIYSFTFNFGCLPKHANLVVQKLIKEGKIKTIRLTSQKVHKIIEEKIQIEK